LQQEENVPEVSFHTHGSFQIIGDQKQGYQGKTH
jgi:hypothetical protein